MANSFWQREKGMKKMNSIVFKVWKTRKLLKAFGKRRKRSSKRFRNQLRKFFKEYSRYRNANQSLAFIDSSCLVKRTIRRVIAFRKT